MSTLSLVGSDLMVEKTVRTILLEECLRVMLRPCDSCVCLRNTILRLDSFPEEMAAVRDAGHEIGLHGYSHENPIAMTFDQQKEVLDHTFKQLSDFCEGVKPEGSVAPWWESSKEGVQLLLDKGIQYDHSSQAHDCLPFYCRDEDTWTKINYEAKSAKEWMKPIVNGQLTNMVQIPANWYLDDLPPHMFIKNSANSRGFVDADVALKLWKKHWDYFY